MTEQIRYNEFDIDETYGDDENEASFRLTHMPERWAFLSSKDEARLVRDEYITKVNSCFKLEELLLARIKSLDTELDIIVKTTSGAQSCGSDYHLKILNERNYYQTLLEESKKEDEN